MYLDVYIGEVDVPGFSWQDSPSDGEYYAVSPRIISDSLPESFDIFWDVLDRTHDENSTSKAFDWGKRAVRVSKAELVEFLRSKYGRDIMEEGGEYVHSRQDQLRDLRAEPDSRFLVKGREMEIKAMLDLISLVDGLISDREYALVAQES
jgi:hypothetical protein